MHQQPPHTPLWRSTSCAKSDQVLSSRGLARRPVLISDVTGAQSTQPTRTVAAAPGQRAESETTEGPHQAGPQHVNCQAWLGRGRLVAFRHVELGELVGEPGLAGAGADLLQRGEILVEGRPEATQAVAVAEPKLGRDLVGVQKP